MKYPIVVWKQSTFERDYRPESVDNFRFRMSDRFNTEQFRTEIKALFILAIILHGTDAGMSSDQQLEHIENVIGR